MNKEKSQRWNITEYQVPARKSLIFFNKLTPAGHGIFHRHQDSGRNVRPAPVPFQIAFPSFKLKLYLRLVARVPPSLVLSIQVHCVWILSVSSLPNLMQIFSCDQAKPYQVRDMQYRHSFSFHPVAGAHKLRHGQRRESHGAGVAGCWWRWRRAASLPKRPLCLLIRPKGIETLPKAWLLLRAVQNNRHTRQGNKRSWAETCRSSIRTLQLLNWSWWRYEPLRGCMIGLSWRVCGWRHQLQRFRLGQESMTPVIHAHAPNSVLLLFCLTLPRHSHGLQKRLKINK